jgi:hypothetical protein
MSLEHITADASLERKHYHELSARELEQRRDAEALFERGRRLGFGVGTAKKDEEGWALIVEAARLGHPVALAFCFHFGQATQQSSQRSCELLKTSSARGHPAGMHTHMRTRSTCRNSSFLRISLFFALSHAAQRKPRSDSTFRTARALNAKRRKLRDGTVRQPSRIIQADSSISASATTEAQAFMKIQQRLYAGIVHQRCEMQIRTQDLAIATNAVMVLLLIG